jgi:hypothetical protein
MVNIKIEAELVEEDGLFFCAFAGGCTLLAGSVKIRDMS